MSVGRVLVAAFWRPKLQKMKKAKKGLETIETKWT
jgi:hypothetical protein